MPFGSTCLPPALVAAAMQRIRDRFSALEDRKGALLQEHKDLIVHDLTPQPEVLVQVVKDTFLDGGSGCTCLASFLLWCIVYRSNLIC